jgi:hypothetical protein
VQNICRNNPTKDLRAIGTPTVEVALALILGAYLTHPVIASLGRPLFRCAIKRAKAAKLPNLERKKSVN